MLINLENVSKKFGAKTLFKDINFNATYAFTIGNKDRVARAGASSVLVYIIFDIIICWFNVMCIF